MIVSEESNAPGTTAFVTILEAIPQVDEHGDSIPPPAPFSALVVNHHGRGLNLLAPRRIALNTALKIEASEAIWLGTVQACSKDDASADSIADGSAEAHGSEGPKAAEQQWNIEIQVTRVLRDLDTLKRLANLFGSAQNVNPPLFRGVAILV